MLNKFNQRRGGFTLVEIMIVVAIIALLAAIAVPGFLRARKRSQASRIINDLRLIDSAVDQYANARLMATEYREEMLPRAKKAYGLMADKYGQTLASYPRVLDAQRKLYELQIEYIAALESVWTNGIALQGYLLTDGLEAPARPSEVDRPVRETNVPMPERTMSPRGRLPEP